MVAPGVVGPVPAGEIPRPLPPGVVLVAAREPGRTARRLARTLGAGRTWTGVEARQELLDRRAAELAPHRARAAHARAAVATATAAADEARTTLAPGLAGVTPADVRLAAERVERSRRSAETARAALGPRPRFDEEAVRAAHAAHAELEDARRGRGARVPAVNSLLTMANCGAGTLVVGRIFTDAFDPAFFLVAVLPLAALGYTASVVVRHLHRCRTAARRRWSALRSLDLCTMAGLASLEADARDWAERRRRAKVAAGRADEAEAAWRALAGPDVDVADVSDVVAAVERVDALEARRQEAVAAWARTAVALQCAEDLAGAAEEPIVVVDRRSSPGTTLTPSELAAGAGLASVVVVRPVATVAVHAEPVASEPAEPAPRDDPAPAQPEPVQPETAPDFPEPVVVPVAGSVVDLRERVLSGLLRLRSRAAARDRQPPGPVAADG